MIAYLITFLCLLVELALLPLRYLLGVSNRKTNSLILDDSTPDLSSSSHSSLDSSDTQASSYDEDRSAFCCRHNHSDFVVDQVSQALHRKGRKGTLEFFDFVDRAKNAQDAIGLMDLLRRQQHVKSLHFQDTVDAKTYRRWGFKRTGLYRHVLDQATVPVSFSATLVLDASQPGTLSLLEKEVVKDADIKSLVIQGCNLHHQQAEAVALALVSLLQQSDHSKRVWQTIEWKVQIESQSREAQMVNKVCQKALTKAAKERYIELKL